MPAHPVGAAEIPVVRQRKLRLLHQIVVWRVDVRDGSARITHRQVHAWRIWRCRSGRNSEGPDVIRHERIGVRSGVSVIEIVELVFKQRYRARFVGFFFNDTATTEIYTLSLHDALPPALTWRTLRPSGSRRHAPAIATWRDASE